MRREWIPGLRRCLSCLASSVAFFRVVADDDDGGLGHDDFKWAIVRIATTAGSGLFFLRGHQDLHLKLGRLVTRREEFLQ